MRPFEIAAAKSLTVFIDPCKLAVLSSPSALKVPEAFIEDCAKFAFATEPATALFVTNEAELISVSPAPDASTGVRVPNKLAHSGDPVEFRAA
jgi:hypothetical protein